MRCPHLTHQLDHTTSLLDLLLCEGRHVTCLDDDGDLGQPALSEELCEAERQQVDDGGSITGCTGEVFLAGLGGDKGPQLHRASAKVGGKEWRRGVPCRD